MQLIRFNASHLRKGVAVLTLVGGLAVGVPVAAFASDAPPAHTVILPSVIPDHLISQPLFQPEQQHVVHHEAARAPAHKAPVHKAAPKKAVVHHHKVKPAVKKHHHKAVHHQKHHAHKAICHGAGITLWTCRAFTVLEKHGTPRSALDASAVRIIAMSESAGNPSAINNWDSNAVAGHPSQGLMQTIRTTFDAYCAPQPGCAGDSMLDPVDDIVASARYAISRYGSLGNVPGVQQVRAGGSYVGY